MLEGVASCNTVHNALQICNKLPIARIRLICIYIEIIKVKKRRPTSRVAELCRLWAKTFLFVGTSI